MLNIKQWIVSYDDICKTVEKFPDTLHGLCDVFKVSREELILMSPLPDMGESTIHTIAATALFRDLSHGSSITISANIRKKYPRASLQIVLEEFTLQAPCVSAELIVRELLSANHDHNDLVIGFMRKLIYSNYNEQSRLIRLKVLAEFI